MRTASREALLHSSHAIADLTRRLQATLNLVEPPPSPADDEAHQLAWAKATVRARRQRSSVFGKGLFFEPAWEILLELFIARLEGRETTVKGACLASSAPQTTALRYIATLVERGLVGRQPHPVDSRCTYLHLTDEGYARMVECCRRALQPDAAEA